MCDGSNAQTWSHDSSIEKIETQEQHHSTDARSLSDAAPDIWTPGNGTPRNSVLTALKSVVPKSMAENLSDSTFVSTGTQIFTSSLHRQILFSVANNFAGLGAFSIGQVIRFLQDKTSVDLYALFRSTPGYSSRAIAQNLFKGAIELGDAQIVDFLLKQKFADIDLNQQFWLIEGDRYTPIERASALRHKTVIKSLLDHHANVKRTFSDRWSPSGALDCAVGMRGIKGKYTRVDTEIFRMLLKSGGDLSKPMMTFLIDRRDGELVDLIMSENARRNVTKWSKWGTFHHAIRVLDDQTSMGTIKRMIDIGADLNYHVEGLFHVKCSRSIIDVAAQRGNLEMMNILLNSGASLTGDTLPCAVASGNIDMVLSLLRKKADINSIGFLRITPLAAAIRLQDAKTIELVIGHGALAKISDQAHFSAALKAASKVGNVQFIDYLIQLGVQLGNLIWPADLGYALTIAIRNGQDDVANMLIDAGADVNVRSNSIPEGRWPLHEALKRRNAALVHSLLDADADPNNGNFGDKLYWGTSAIQVAAEWGDYSVLEALIVAGAEVNDRSQKLGSNAALTIAVTKQDRVLVDLLLNAGADLNNPGTRLVGGTALEAAAKNGDVNMARYLLDQGADPEDSLALKEAALHNKKLFNLLLERHAARYPMGRTGFGSRVLMHAIKKGDKPLLKMMLARKADANKFLNADRQYATPFGYAISKEQEGRAKFVELLLLAGCNPNSIVSQASQWGLTKSGARITALLAAIGTQNLSTVELLIRYGADVDSLARGLVKRTPLQRAAEIGNIEIVELLINHGANVNAPAARRGGGTALQLAAIGGYIRVACMLLNRKADVDSPASKVNGRTVLEGAAEHGRLDMVKLLLNEGAGSRGKDQGQCARAIALARDSGHFPICDLLEAYVRAEDQGSGLEMLVDFEGNGEDLINWDGDGDIFSL